MEHIREELIQPVSPMGQCFNSSVMCINVLAVLEFEVPIDDFQIASHVRDVLLPVNPRFSSVMVSNKNGKKVWKQVEVKLEEHIIIPKFPVGMSADSYEECFNDYLPSIAMEQLPQNKPLWEIHVIIYPRSKSAGTLIFKLSHALGDGFSLMGLVLSCFERADNPSLPLTFSSRKRSKLELHKRNIFMRLPQLTSVFFNSISDFVWYLLKTSVIEDDKTPIRSGDEGVVSRPVTISNLTFFIDQIKEIKSKLGVTMNDVITGVVFYGLRQYMQDLENSSKEARSTALVMLNTRNIEGYQSVKNMLNKDTEGAWGNRASIVHVPMPKLKDTMVSNPLLFVLKAHKIIHRKRKSFAVLLAGRLLQMQYHIRGVEAVAKHIYSSLRKSSLAFSSMVGPVDQIAMANHPVNGFYYSVVGGPENLGITMMSYMGMLRVTLKMEKGFIIEQKLKSFVMDAFDKILKAARDMPTSSVDSKYLN